MAKHESAFETLAARLPDLPRWVETRSLLLSGRANIFGLSLSDPFSLVVSSPELELISVIGFPPPAAIPGAVIGNQEKGVVLAMPENNNYVGEALKTWKAEPAVLHTLDDCSRLPDLKHAAIRLLDHEDVNHLSVPPDLKEELMVASLYSPVAATLAGDLPVAFCYAGAVTERWWDISIDTLAEHRGKGYAGLVVSYMIRYMKDWGKAPVWGAEESNTASMKLAAKLGFVPADRLFVFHNKKNV